MPRITRLLPLLLTALLALPGRPAAQEATVVILVRHAEKADTTADPRLSERGRERAEALARALAHTRVGAIVVTQYRRTQLTAQPLAQKLGITPDTARAGGNANPRTVADRILSRHAGKTVLVVGHSNSVPGIIAALGGPRLPQICDSEYANLFVLVLRPGKEPSLVHSRYGAADPPDPACGGPTRQ
ncbi:MAG TPA: phosphoglycerate mutase family protein [Longimicrobiaceae bacterium]|nr:phosphoglycerate mutase family protein [Longimicrobiaceae bacterium]